MSFQVIQRYAHGAIRVSASRLFQPARLPGKSPGFFFEGLAAGEMPGKGLLEAALSNSSGLSRPSKVTN